MSDYMVYGYARVSTENQIENYSIDEQVERIQAFCKAKGWTLLDTFIDRGFSGGNTDRPSLSQLLESVRRHEADAVVVYKLDRLSRSQKDTLTLIEDEFLSNKTDFISINENFDTSTPFGRAMIGILSVFAQLEKDQITERFTMGRIGRSKAGYYHGGPTPPTGYHYINGELQIDPIGERQVHQVFDMYTSGVTINSIMKRMKTEYGGNWSATKVADILRNSVYIGKVKFAGQEYDGVHQPIIDKEQYFSVQRMLEKRPAPIRQPFRASNLLTGLIFCARCGARYSGNHGYYKCYSRAKSSLRFVKDPDCHNDNWKIEKLDAHVIQIIKKICEDKAQIKNYKHGPSIEEKELAAKKKFANIDNQIEKLIELYQISAIPIDALTKKVKALRAEKAALEAQLESDKSELPPIEERLLSFERGFDGSDFEAQRLLISSIIERIDIDGQNIEVTLRI